MKKFKLLLPMTLFLFFMTSCSKPNAQTDIFQLKDQGTLDVTFTAILDSKEGPITQETNIPLESLESLQIRVATDQPELPFKIYFDQTDIQFPIDSSLKKESNGKHSIIQEDYHPNDYPEFFTLGKHQINIFQINPEGESNSVPNVSNIKGVKTFSYEITK